MKYANYLQNSHNEDYLLPCPRKMKKNENQKYTRKYAKRIKRER